jgi:hypothetical protein
MPAFVSAEGSIVGVGVRQPGHADYGSDACQHWMLVSTGRSVIIPEFLLC